MNMYTVKCWMRDEEHYYDDIVWNDMMDICTLKCRNMNIDARYDLQFFQIKKPLPKSSAAAIRNAPPSVSEFNNLSNSFVTCDVKLSHVTQSIDVATLCPLNQAIVNQE